MYRTLTVGTLLVPAAWLWDVLDHGVRAGKEQERAAVLEPHQVRRFASVSVHFDDFSVLVRMADAVTAYADVVTDSRFHACLPPP
jgi:hypothetical protein